MTGFGLFVLGVYDLRRGGIWIIHLISSIGHVIYA